MYKAWFTIKFLTFRKTLLYRNHEAKGAANLLKNFLCEISSESCSRSSLWVILKHRGRTSLCLRLWCSQLWLFYSRHLNGLISDRASYVLCPFKFGGCEVRSQNEMGAPFVCAANQPAKRSAGQVEHVFRLNIAPESNAIKDDDYDDDLLGRYDLLLSRSSHTCRRAKTIHQWCHREMPKERENDGERCCHRHAHNETRIFYFFLPRVMSTLT